MAIDGEETADFRFEDGAVVLPASREGARVTAGFLFDVPVRFATDEIAVSLTHFRAGELPAIPLVEVLA